VSFILDNKKSSKLFRKKLKLNSQIQEIII